MSKTTVKAILLVAAMIYEKDLPETKRLFLRRLLSMKNHSPNHLTPVFHRLVYGLLLFAIHSPLAIAETYKDNVKASFQAIMSNLLSEAKDADISADACPEWVWKKLGKKLQTTPVKFSTLCNKKSSDSYQRIPIYRTIDYPDTGSKTVPFAVVAIVLSPGQSTVTHDHYVECGPLLVYGDITEIYGYTDALVKSRNKVAILNNKRTLKKYQPAQYFFPNQNNTHRLVETSNNHSGIALNLYVQEEGDSVKNRFPTFIGTTPDYRTFF